MKLYDMAKGICCSDYQVRGCRPLLAVIAGEEYSIRIDCGASPAHRLEYEKLYLQLHPGSNIKKTVLTHGHWDHFAGGKGDTQLIMSAVAWEDICEQKKGTKHTFSQNGMLAEYGRDSLPDHIWQNSIPDRLLHVDEGVTELDLGGRRVRLHVLDSDHASGNILIEVPKEGIVFIGDAIYLGEEADKWFYTRKIHSIIDYMKQMDAKWYVGSHREPMNMKELIQFDQHLQQLEEMTDGIHTEMMMKKKYIEKYGSLPKPVLLEELMWLVNGNRRQLYEGK